MLIIATTIIIVTSDNGLIDDAYNTTTQLNNRIAKDEQITAGIIDEIKEELSVDKTHITNEPNAPKLVTGMTPIKFTLPEGDVAGTVITTTSTDDEWYNYNEQKWANAKTNDGSMWVWIPRFAYKINSNQTTEVVFLGGTSDHYFDEDGNTKTAKRAKTKNDVVDATKDFVVHPAFTNESGIGYRNGGWDKELTGIWVAKFEAGYPSGNNTAPVVDSNIKYSKSKVWASATERNSDSADNLSARNWLDGIYGATNTMIKYPTFQPLTYSMNYINHSDVYLLARDMTGTNNIYGFTGSTTDSHLMKNSEWGAVAYLSKSKYGLFNTDIAINNININSGGSATTKAEGNNYASAYAITGVTQRK